MLRPVTRCLAPGPLPLPRAFPISSRCLSDTLETVDQKIKKVAGNIS